jgi:hypothetical protein
MILLLTALAAAGPLAAEPPAPQAQAEEQRLICRGGQRQLSSRIRSQRRCRTAEQWQEEDERNRTGLPLSAQITQGQNDGRQSAQPR